MGISYLGWGRPEQRRSVVVLGMALLLVGLTGDSASARSWDHVVYQDGAYRGKGYGNFVPYAYNPGYGATEWSSNSEMWATDPQPNDQLVVYSQTAFFQLTEKCQNVNLAFSGAYAETVNCGAHRTHVSTVSTHETCEPGYNCGTRPPTDQLTVTDFAAIELVPPGNVVRVRACIQNSWPVPDKCSEWEGAYHEAVYGTPPPI